MIRLHHCPGTRSMRSLWLLNELGVDFELVTWPFDKTLRGPDFKALNPTGRVPALEMDGAVIVESGAIAEVLCETFPEAGCSLAIEVKKIFMNEWTGRPDPVALDAIHRALAAALDATAPALESIPLAKTS